MCKATHRLRPLVCLALARSDIQLIVEFRIIDVDLMWIDANNRTCTLSEHSPTSTKQSQVIRTIFLVILEYLPSVLSTESDIVVELISESQCSKAWTRNVRDG